MADSYSFGAWLRRRRRALDLTQDALALRVGCSKDLIVRIEGDARRPSRQVAELLAAHLQLAPEERGDFIRAARAELAADRLPPPTQSVPRPALVAARSVPAAPIGNLPAELSSFVGREREAAELGALLRAGGARLVTLTGPGGTGKTRLALRVAAALRPAYPDGVWFVDLAPISDPLLLAPAIAQALGLHELSDQPAHIQLASGLRTKQLLLLLDNFEQVAEAAPVVAELLRAAPGVRALVTSRAPLRLSGEHEFAVAPLALPQFGTTIPTQWSIEELSRYDAVRLFIERAGAIRPTLIITSQNAPAIAEICVRLDGLPLAIELAAARMRLFSPDELLARLQQSMLRNLIGGARDLPARQQTIQATIGWSYWLLSPPQQRLLARLGVFVGGWTLEAAEAVCSEEGLDIAEGLYALVEHSLVRVAEVRGAPRYAMLETIRAFAWEQARLMQLEDATHQRLTRYLVALMERMNGNQHVEEWDERAIDERGNCAVAFRWCLAASDDRGDSVELGLRLAKALRIYWFVLAPREGITQLTQLLSHPQSQQFPLLRARLLSSLGSIYHTQAHYELALEALERSRAIFEALGHRTWLSEVYRHLGEIFLTQQAADQAQIWFERSLTIAEELQQHWDLAWTHYDFARLAAGAGDWQKVQIHYAASCAAGGDRAFVSRNLAVQAMIAGQYELATNLLTAALREAVDQGETILIYREMVLNAIKQQRFSEARIQLQIALQCLLAYSWPEQETMRMRLSDLLLYTAVIARTERLFERAVAVLSYLSAHLPPPSARPFLLRSVIQPLADEALSASREALGDAAFDAAWAAGRALTLEQAVAEALALTAVPARPGAASR